MVNHVCTLRHTPILAFSYKKNQTIHAFLKMYSSAFYYTFTAILVYFGFSSGKAPALKYAAKPSSNKSRTTLEQNPLFFNPMCQYVSICVKTCQYVSLFAKVLAMLYFVKFCQLQPEIDDWRLVNSELWKTKNCFCCYKKPLKQNLAGAGFNLPMSLLFF